MPEPPIAAAELAAMLEAHRPFYGHPGDAPICSSEADDHYQVDWPCDAYRAASNLTALRAAAEALDEPMDGVRGVCVCCDAYISVTAPPAREPHREYCSFRQLRALLPPASGGPRAGG